MGVFTVYCIVCGGPGMDLSSWAEDEDKRCFFAGSNLVPEDFCWLGQQVALTPRGVWEGICDDYGRMHCAQGTACVLKLNWGPVPAPKAHEWSDGDEDSSGEMPAILCHRICYQLFLAEAAQQYRHGQVFQRLSKQLEDMSQALNCVPQELYGDILNNQGQDYEMNDGEAWMIAAPTPTHILSRVHSHRPREALFPGITLVDLALKICSFLDFQSLLALGMVSRLGFEYSRYHPLLPSYECSSFDEATGEWKAFGTREAARNYERVSAIGDSICRACFPPKPVKEKETWEDCSVSELKEHLRERDLKVTGKKADLIARLKESGFESPLKKAKK